MVNDADITFTIGLNTSQADIDIAEFQKLLKHNDKINTLNTLRSNASSSYSSLMNAGKWVRSGDAYEVQDYERMLRQQASRIRGLDRTLRQSFTISPREFILKGDSYYNMPPAVIGSAQTAYNNYSFKRDAFNNMMGRAGQNILALPAPKTTLSDNDFEAEIAALTSPLDDSVAQLAERINNDYAHEFANRLNGFENNAKEQNDFEAEIAALTSPLDDSVGSSADNKIKDKLKERRIKEGLLAKAERLKTASSLDDFVAPLADNRIDNAIKTKEEEMSKLASSLDETIGKSFEERINSIQTPSGTDTKENDIQKENKALKDQEKEKKNNAKEEKGSLVRFGKMLGKLYLIKKVLSAIKDIWKRLSDTELKVTQRDVKEKGFFGVDAYSAMHANVDRSHAVISRGLGYMGAAAPFSMEAFDSVLQQLQDLKLKAISGQGIADEQLVISLQRLSDALGMGFNIKDILTNPNLNLTDFLTGLMNSVEKFLPKLNKLDDIQKSLVTNDIIKALGPELANALVYNYNYNQRTGGTSTVMEQVTSKGTNAYGLIDYTEEAKKFTDALASSRAALDEFKITLADFFAPAGKKIADQVTENVSEASMMLKSLTTDSKGWSFSLVYSGASDLISKDREEQSDWYKKQENQEFAARMLESAMDFSSLDDILNFEYYNPTALAAGTSSASLETTVGLWKGDLLAQKIYGKSYNQVRAERKFGKTKFSDEEWAAVEDIYKNHFKDIWKFKGDNWDIFNTKSWKKLFDEGGAWDIQKGEPPKHYVETMLGKEGYQLLLISALAEKYNFLQEAGIMKEGGLSYYTKDEYDKQGNKISGTITLRLDLTDGRTIDIPTTFEEGMVNAIVNVPSLQTGK